MAYTRSYSQLSQWTECPRQYQLCRLAKVPRRPGWWFPGGTAVHKVIELYLRDQLPTVVLEEAFRSAFADAIGAEYESSGFDPDTWDSAGRGNTQDREWWLENGPRLARNFIDWYESKPDVNVWTTPDGKPAIELDLTARFGSVDVRAVVDLVLAMGDENPALVVVDLKSGSTYPHSDRQLATGVNAIERVYGIRPRYATFFMLRGTGTKKNVFFQEPPLETRGVSFNVTYLANEFGMFDKAVQEGIFPANPGDSCRRCPVAYACAEVGGEMSSTYDPNHPLNIARALARYEREARAKHV